jgi:hypothetical protein
MQELNREKTLEALALIPVVKKQSSAHLWNVGSLPKNPAKSVLPPI